MVSFLKELAANSNEFYKVTLLWDTQRPKEQERLKRIGASRPNLDLVFDDAACLDDEDLSFVSKFSTVVLLADQNQAPLVADAENIMRCVQLDQIFRNKTRPHLLVELNDEDNRVLLKDIPSDILMTSEILSHLLAQVSHHRSLMWVYEELFTKGGAELRLRSLSESSQSLENLAFHQAQALEKGSVLLGFSRAGQVHLSSSPTEMMRENDQLITIELEES